MRDFVRFSTVGLDAMSDGSLNYAFWNKNTMYMHDNKQELCMVPRPTFLTPSSVSYTASSHDDRGRGIFYLDQVSNGQPVYVVTSTYYYNDGASNTSLLGGNDFEPDQICTGLMHNVSGTSNFVLVNAGRSTLATSTESGNVWYTPDRSTLPTRITDADMPGNNGYSLLRGGASLDGYLFLADVRGRIYNSALNDMTTWAATDFLTAEREPDLGLYLGKVGDHIAYIGTGSIELFYNAGNASGSPLSRRTDISYSIGAIGPNAITQNGDKIYFIGTDSVTLSLYMLSQDGLQRLGDLGTEPLISRVESRDKSVSLPSNVNSNLSYAEALVHIPAAGRDGLLFSHSSLGYSIYWDGFAWHQWEVGTSFGTYDGMANSGTGNFPVVSSAVTDVTATQGTSYPTVQFTNGEMGCQIPFPTSTTQFLDLGTTAYSLEMKLPIWDAGTNHKKRINWVKPMIYGESSATALYANNCELNLYWRDSDKANSGQDRNDVSTWDGGRTFGFNTLAPPIHRLGVTRGRRFGIEGSFTGVFRLYGLEIDYDIV